MNIEASAPTPQCSGLLTASLQEVDKAHGDSSTDTEDTADEEALLTQHDGPATDELARKMLENETRLLQRIARMKQKKKQLKAMLGAYRQKEEEFVSRMDSHMDEVESTEHELSLKIETLTAENQQLRDFTDKRAQDNSESIEKLNETIKQCSESETRVQFLVDRIVALMSAGSADPAQTEAVVSMRRREQEMLRQLEETRQQFNEVRQQNGELTSRLTEELGLSRRLSDQLAEVEERFFRKQQTEHPVPAEAPCTEMPLPPRAGRLGPRPLGLRSDQTEAPGGAPDRLPAPIGEYEESCSSAPICEGDSQLEGSLMVSGRRMPLGVVLEAEAPRSPDPELEEEQEVDADGLGSAERTVEVSDGLQYSGRQTGSPRPPQPPNNSARASVVGPLYMEQKLREALDSASFECAVVRVETGVYNFGPHVRATVKLTADNEVVAAREDGHFEPIEDFIRNIAREARSPQEPWASGPSSSVGDVTAVAEGDEAEGILGESSCNALPTGETVLMDGFLASGGSGEVAPPQVGARLTSSVGSMASQQQQQPPSTQYRATGGGLAPDRAGVNSSSGVPPLQLHAAAVAPPLLGHRLSSTTPERSRVRGVAPRTATWSGAGGNQQAQIVSPRPQRSHKPGAGTAAPAPSPRMVVAPGAARLGVAQSPGRQYCPPQQAGQPSYAG